MPDLKPCPFCGVAAQHYPYEGDFCRCQDRECPGHYWSKICRWNTRAPAPPSEGIRMAVYAVYASCALVGTGRLTAAEADDLIIQAGDALTDADRAACGERDG